MATYSHSKLTTYENCPFQYQLKYIEKPGIEKRDGIEAFVGSRFHETMEKLYGELKFDKVHTREELLDYYDTQWDKNYHEHVTIVKKDHTPEDYKNMGRKSVREYYERHYPFNQSRVLGIEKKITINLDETGTYKVIGYIDRIGQADDGTYEIHDYKTSGTLPAQEYLDQDRQLALYHIGLLQTWNDVRKVRLIWHYVVFDKTMSSYRTLEQLENLKKDTIALIDKIEADEKFLPHETHLCNWCDYQDLCPKKKHLVKVANLPVNEYLNDDGVNLVNTFEKLDNQKKALKHKMDDIDEEIAKVKEAIIFYGEKEDMEVIVGSDKQANITTTTKIEIPKKGSDEWQQLEEKLKSLNKWDDVSTMNHSAIKRAIKDGAWTEEELKTISDFYNKTDEKQVRISKVKE